MCCYIIWNRTIQNTWFDNANRLCTHSIQNPNKISSSWNCFTSHEYSRCKTTAIAQYCICIFATVVLLRDKFVKWPFSSTHRTCFWIQDLALLPIITVPLTAILAKKIITKSEPPPFLLISLKWMIPRNNILAIFFLIISNTLSNTLWMQMFVLIARTSLSWYIYVVGMESL